MPNFQGFKNNVAALLLGDADLRKNAFDHLRGNEERGLPGNPTYLQLRAEAMKLPKGSDLRKEVKAHLQLCQLKVAQRAVELRNKGYRKDEVVSPLAKAQLIQSAIREVEPSLSSTRTLLVKLRTKQFNKRDARTYIDQATGFDSNPLLSRVGRSCLRILGSVLTLVGTPWAKSIRRYVSDYEGSTKRVRSKLIANVDALIAADEKANSVDSDNPVYAGGSRACQYHQAQGGEGGPRPANVDDEGYLDPNVDGDGGITIN